MAVKQIGQGALALGRCLMQLSADCTAKESTKLLVLNQVQTIAVQKGASEALAERTQGIKDLPASLEGLKDYIAEHPAEAMGLLMDAIGNLPANVIEEYKTRLSNIGGALLIGGPDKFEQAGEDMMNIAVDMAIASASGGALKAGEKVTQATAEKLNKALADIGVDKAIKKAEKEALSNAKENLNFHKEDALYDGTKEIQTTSGIVIRSNPGKVTTVLGTYGADTRRIIDAELDAPKTMTDAPAPGSFNLLNRGT